MLKVNVAQGNIPYEITVDALAQQRLPDLSNHKILLKPNVARLLPPDAGATTNPQVVAAIIDFLYAHGAGEVAIGESPITGVNVMEAFDVCGIRKVAEKRGVPLLDFDNNPYKILNIPHGKIIKNIKVTSFIDYYDYIVSIPVMKTHMHTGVTLSIKNMKGMLWRRQKIVFHQIQAPRTITKGEKELNIAISDMARVLYPDLVILDGTIGMEGLGPSAGEPKGAGIVVVSENATAGDMIASRLMGIDPNSVPHLRMVAEHKGITEDAIDVSPADYLKWKVDFTPPPEKISISYPDVEIYDQESCSACLTTLFLFLKRHHQDLKSYIGKQGKLHLAIGKGVKNCPKGTIYVGNCSCTIPDAANELKVTGCPPVASQIWEAIKSDKRININHTR